MIVSSFWVCAFGPTLHWCNIRPTLCFHRGSKKYDIINILWSFRLSVSKSKEVVCPYCHKSVVAKGMRKHIASTCTMVPLKIRKEMKARMRRNKKRPTILGLISGVVLFFFFGLFFTLTPFFFYQMGMFNSDEPFTSLLFFAFSIPFLMGGLYIQYKGLGMMRGKIQVYGSSNAPDPTYWDRHNYP